MTTLNHKGAGYTHLVRWEEYSTFLNLYVHKSFPTTDDAVQIHMRHLTKRQANGDKIRNLRSEPL